MKKIFRKNQVIITALAIMIVIAGYLNFTSDSKLLDTSVENMESEGASGNSDDDMVSAAVEDTVAGEKLAKNDVKEMDSVITDETGADVSVSNEGKKTETMKENEGEDVTENTKDTASASLDENGDPIDAESVGEAVLTNGAVTLSEAKINREQTRAKTKDMLLEIINNENLSEESKQDAINKMLSMTERIEKESAAETQLAAKGFPDSVVSISDDSVDVTISCESLTDKQRTQIEDIITRKTGCELNQIVITTMSAQ
ncbi:MAG: SpoIIIAH-like family protein [Clostridiales bacterium]|nr:SpoIIIAH-like family protein [Clostridiales bacterium]